MTIKTALQAGQKRLKTVAGGSDLAWSEAEILLATVLKKDRPWLIAHREEPLPSRPERKFLAYIHRRERHEPIAYITGTKAFYGHVYQVNKHVLIPRPETEELIDLVKKHNPAQFDNETVIWDVGTGSGAIAVTIKTLFPQTHVIASDVSRRALHVAQKNAQTILRTTNTVEWVQGSLLTRHIAKKLNEKKPRRLFVLANLPYLPLSDAHVLQKDVVDFEPHSALFTEEEGNALILKLLRELSGWLKRHPLSLHLILECDPPQTHSLKDMACKLFPQASVSIHPDACGRNRFLQVSA